MDRDEIKDTFETFFEKFKKTEGDESSWSAPWFTITPSGGKFEINMTKCPEGTTFKVFLDNRKLGEISGWDRFFEEIENLTKDHPDAYDEEEFFGSMKDMI
jgi:dihydroorotase-like cyclic amidohydrolase